MKLKSRFAVAVLCLVVGGSAFGRSLDGSEAGVVSNPYDAREILWRTQEFFAPISIPSEQIYNHRDQIIYGVDWSDEGWPDELKKGMSATMVHDFPLYELRMATDPIFLDTVFFNSRNIEICRLPPPAGGFDDDLWYQTVLGKSPLEMSEWERWIFSPFHTSTSILMIPTSLHLAFLVAQGEEAMLEAAMAPISPPPPPMAMGSGVELQMGIENLSNGTVEVLVEWISGIGSTTLDLFHATDLVAANWQLETNFPTAGSTNFYWNDEGTNQRFFVSGTDYDEDLDALSSARERYLYKSEESLPDTDFDGILDGDEVYGDGTHGDSDGFTTDPLVQDTGYLLPDFLYTSPTSNLSGFSAFDPPTTNMAPFANTPAISEWTRTAGPGDTIALAAMGDPTNYVAYAPGLLHTSGTTNWFSGGHGAVTLPSTLPENEMILFWPVNTNGAGPAIALNKTEVWWNQAQAATGEVFSIFGRNLGTNCHVWVEEEDEWIDAVSCNPYKADFLVPTNYSNGSYTLWAHNGSGHQYGFADSLSLDVVSVLPWNENTNNWFDVTDYGATGDGTTDDWPAIEVAIDDADDTPWSTVYFPPGDYRIGSKLRFTNKDEIRAVGAGMDLVTVQPHSNYGTSLWPKYIIHNGLINFEIKGVTLKANCPILT